MNLNVNFIDSVNCYVVSSQEWLSSFFGHDSSDPFHRVSIRAIRYGVKGKLLVTAGDDKLVKIWNTDAWRCIYNVQVFLS